MTIKRRLLIFGTGLLIGTVLSYLLLGWRGCGDWLPERRVRADIEMAGFDESARAVCLRECWDAAGLQPATALEWLYSAELNWDASGPRETPQRYVFNPTAGPAAAIAFTRDGAGGRWTLRITEGEIADCACD